MHQHTNSSSGNVEPPLTPAAVDPAPSLDPFNPASLRIDVSKMHDTGAKKALLSVPVRKPGDQEYVRVHSGDDYRAPYAVIIDKERGETYLVHGNLVGELSRDVKIVDLRYVITRAGDISIWAIPLPPADGRDNPWHQSAREIAELGETKWVRVTAGNGRYEAWEAPPGVPDPVWPEIAFEEVLRIAFPQPRVITDLSHPLVRKLMGY
jgi:hypothetical protein